MLPLGGLSRSLIAGLVSGLGLLCLSAAQADPILAKSGVTQLPTSGLSVDLPSSPNLQYRVSGSWSSNGQTNTFDTRDIIDEFDRTTDAIVAGTWVLTGYFTAGGCDAVLASEKLDSSWVTDATLWGANWKVRGGVYTFDSSLGRRPAAVLCTTNTLGRSLLLYRYLTDESEGLGQADVLERVKKAAVLERVWQAYRAERTTDIFPTRRPEVRNRGTVAPQRTATLPLTKLQVAIPDDGYFWLIEEGEGADILSRLLPSLPEVTVEVATADGLACPDVLAGLTDANPSLHATNLPVGWTVGPAMSIEGETEQVICYGTNYGALLAGFFLGANKTDISALHPLLGALAKASKAP